MRAVLVGRLRLGMALGAGYLLRRRIVHQALHILVTVYAGQKTTMNRMFQLVLVDKDAQRLPVHVFGQRGVGVAGKAVRVFELLRGMSVRDPNENQDNKNSSRQKSSRVHAVEEILIRKNYQ